MATRFLSASERTRLSTFPAAISDEGLAAHFTLTPEDLAAIEQRRGERNRLGFALQLCTLRFLGFVPDDLSAAPAAVLTTLASQLEIPLNTIDEYGLREHTRQDHRVDAMAALGFRSFDESASVSLSSWLIDRALEHDRPTVLLELACERLRVERIVRPGITILERLVGSVRARADVETRAFVEHLLIPERMASLDALLVPDPALGRTRLAWLRSGTSSPTPKAIVAELAKLRFLRELGAHGWDLSALTPNRRRHLAQLARRSTNQALQRANGQRRYPALLAFCSDSVAEIIDEVVDLFDRSLANTDARARRALDDLRRKTARATNEKVHLFVQVGRILLDPDADPEEKLARIDARIGLDRLRRAVEEAEELARPEDDSYFDLLADRYLRLRQFTPALLEALELRATASAAQLLEAVEVLRALNVDGRRTVPDDAPLDFVATRWRPYVLQAEGRVSRRYWELCLLTELRAALRAGDVWVVGSRRYANPETYLIAPEHWPELRAEVASLIGAPLEGEARLEIHGAELARRVEQLNWALIRGKEVRLADGELVVSRLSAEEVPSECAVLADRVAERLPHIELADLLIEVDRWCGFSRHFTHAGGSTSRTRDLAVHLYAAILAQACNFGVTTMAEAADLTYRQLAWTGEWYIRDDTLRAANAAIVNYQHRLPLSQVWGGGTLSSSDGQRFPVAVKSPVATALPRYFGLGRGVTAYTHVSDQHSTYATRVIPATVRDATYVLDGLLDNETELPIVEHTTDTAGYTEIVFALFDLLGLQFAPRIRDLADQRLYRLGEIRHPGPAGQLLRGTINRRLILDRWDDLLRIAGSLKLGWVTASLLISRLQASPRQNALARALQEYGRLVKTVFILGYLEDEDCRRRITRQLNKGETVHALRRFLFFGGEGKVRRRRHEDQTNQASCLTLVTNAIITWNTAYMAAALDALRAEGQEVGEVALGHLSPALHEHVNPYGKYRFDLDAGLGREGLRPLRQPERTEQTA